MYKTILLTVIATCAYAQQQQFAELGECKLTSGETIRQCRLGYRTIGALNADKSNAILWPTWFSGTTADLVGLVGPGRMLDSTGLFIILVDAIGDGVSTSPSNSTAQPRMSFPKFTVRDMVNAEHRLATETLGLRRLRAVVGISMGGMQTFEWMTAYPDFAERAVPIVGTPQLTAYDMLLWETEAHLIEDDKDWNAGNYKKPPPLRALRDLHTLALTTPEGRNKEVRLAAFPEFLKNAEHPAKVFDANDWLRQLQAMMAHDVAADSGGSLENAAKRVKARVLNIVSARDHMVNPGTALEYAKLIGARTVVLESDCGHLATSCEGAKIAAAANEFLH